MDEKQLIDEVIRELKKKIELESLTHPLTRKAAVIGTLREEEFNALKAAYTVVSLEEQAGGTDIIVLAQLPLNLMADLALGICDNRESSEVLQTLLNGKEVYIMESGIEYRSYKESAHKNLYRLYQEYEDSILKYGVRLISHTTDIWKDKMISTVQDSEYMDLTNQSLLRESDFMKARNKGIVTVLVDQEAIITPLARDYITNHNLTVKGSAKR